MQLGEYLNNRYLPGMVEAACSRQGIMCIAYSDEWILRLTKGKKVKYVCGYKFDINPSAAGLIAQDKVATYLTLMAHGVPAVPHFLVRSLAGEKPHSNVPPDPEGEGFVVKPLFGTGGRGVMKYGSIEEVLTMVQGSEEPGWAVSPYLELKSEMRLVVLDGQVVLAYDKLDPVVKKGLKLFNLGFGAKAKTMELPSSDPRLVLALRAVDTIGLRAAAIDIVTTDSGENMVLEANDGLMFENYARQSDENKHHAAEVYNAIVAEMFR